MGRVSLYSLGMTSRFWKPGTLAAGIAVSLSLAACAGAPSNDSFSSSEGFPTADSQMAAGEETQVDVSGADGGEVDSAHIIVSGDATIVSGDPIEAARRFAAHVVEVGGLVESDSSSEFEGDPSAYVSARIPEDRFQEVMNGLGEFGKVSNSSVNRQDVTSEVLDLDARITVLEDSIARLKELMDQASGVDELIAAETGLTERQAELDSLRSQREWLEDQVAMSSLWVSFTTAQDAPGFTFAKAWRVFLNSIEVVAYAAIVVLPWAAVIGTITAVVVVKRRKRAIKQSSRLDAEQTEA